MAIKKEERVKINEGIRAFEVRVIGPEGNLGTMPTRDALKKAQELGLDLIEISPNATPPVCKIMDYGKYQYEAKKHTRDRRVKEKSAAVEVKSIQIKVGTGEGDLKTKINKIVIWLNDGDRVKIELYLQGRSKYVEKTFLYDRINKFLALLPTQYTIVENFKEAPKGISLIIEKLRTNKESPVKPPVDTENV